MRIPLSWLAEFVDLPNDINVLTTTLDDLGLVVEGVEHVGQGLESVVVARIEEIHAIEGADRIRRVIATAGAGPVEIVCGAMNFVVGNHVPLAPVGAVLPGGFEIAQRKMRGVVSNGMLCSGRELGLDDDHEGLMILDGRDGLRIGQRLVDLLAITPDVILEISPEGNRPDAWSVEGVARDLGARFALGLRTPSVAVPNVTTTSGSYASGAISSPYLCGTLCVGVLRDVTVTLSPKWLQDRLVHAGMRAVNNVVDASNYVMLELGQPTHPYDASLVERQHIGVRRAHPGEVLVTLDGETRTLGQPGRGLGDTGIDCVIVDGDDRVIGLAGIMGGASSEITSSTTDVLVEAAFFDPMTIARTSKRLGLRTEASNRFERGVDPTLAPRALARFVDVLQLSSPNLSFFCEPISVTGDLPKRPTLSVSQSDVDRLLGTRVALDVAAALLRAIGFEVVEGVKGLVVVPAPARLDVRDGAAGRADVIEEIARLYSYSRLERRTPTWVEPGGLSTAQKFRRRVRDCVVGLGFVEAWTPSLVSDSDFELTSATPLRVRITNPLAADEAVLRSSIVVGLARAWSRNLDRGLGDEAFFEIGTVVDHPGFVDEPRSSRGGVAGAEKVELPNEREILQMLLGRVADDAESATATWHVMAERLGLSDVVVRSAAAPKGWHPTRHATLVDRATGELVGRVGELDPAFISLLAPSARVGQRAGLIEIDLGVLANESKVLRRSPFVTLPSRYPSASIDLAFRTPDAINALDLADALASTSDLVDEVSLFDVFRGPSIGEGVRSLAYAVRLSSPERTLSDAEIATCREQMIATANSLGAQLR